MSELKELLCAECNVWFLERDGHDCPLMEPEDSYEDGVTGHGDEDDDSFDEGYTPCEDGSCCICFPDNC